MREKGKVYVTRVLAMLCAVALIIADVPFAPVMEALGATSSGEYGNGTGIYYKCEEKWPVTYSGNAYEVPKLSIWKSNKNSDGRMPDEKIVDILGNNYYIRHAGRIEIGDGITYVGKNFYKTDDLDPTGYRLYVTIGKDVKEIGDYAFYLKASTGTVIYDLDVTVDGKIEKIGQSSFYSNRIGKLTMDFSEVKSIGDYGCRFKKIVASGRKNVHSVNLENCTSVGKWAFLDSDIENVKR